MQPIITANNLVKKFDDLTAVDGISFAIERGECFGFLGPNGAGKTTTVRMIHCVSPKTAGELKVAGMDANVDNREIKKMIGLVPQEINLDGDLTVYENLLLFSEFYDIKRKVAEPRIAELLDFIELRGKAQSKIDELSTGMKRRLQIARALINQPKIIIADEPTTGLDPQARHMIWQRLRELKKMGATMILTTQYMEEAEQLCDRVVIMHKGQILRQGPVAKMIDEEIGSDVAEIDIDCAQDEKIISSVSSLASGHERVGDILYIYSRQGHELRKKIFDLNLPKVLNRPSSLEDVFLKITGRGLIE